MYVCFIDCKHKFTKFIQFQISKININNIVENKTKVHQIGLIFKVASTKITT